MSVEGLDVDEQQPVVAANTAAQRAAQTAQLNLDDLERDDPAAGMPPYTFTLQGRTLTLMDPVEIDWQDLVNMSRDPGSFALAAMNSSDRKFFEGIVMPAWKVAKLVDDYQSYYDIEEQSGKARG